MTAPQQILRGDQRPVAVGPGDVVARDDDFDCRVHLGLPEVVELEFIRLLGVRTFSTALPYSAMCLTDRGQSGISTIVPGPTPTGSVNAHGRQEPQ
jgi:hypothetical protein